MARKRWWGEFKTHDFDALDPDAVIAVLPVAAIEQHGPHLPVATDTVIMEAMLTAVAASLPEAMDVRILPVQTIGKSDEHLRFPGTLSLTPETAIAAWSQIGEGVARSGIRKLVIVTSHGGNEEVIGLVARRLRIDCDMMVVRTSWGRFGTPDGLFSDREKAVGIHGGDYETSIMLHTAPHLVDMSKARDFASATEEARQSFSHLAPQSPHGFAWLAGDLNEVGVVGEAHLATAQKGKAAMDHQARGFVKLLHDVAKARLADWIRK